MNRFRDPALRKDYERALQAYHKRIETFGVLLEPFRRIVLEMRWQRHSGEASTVSNQSGISHRSAVMPMRSSALDKTRENMKTREPKGTYEDRRPLHWLPR